MLSVQLSRCPSGLLFGQRSSWAGGGPGWSSWTSWTSWAGGPGWTSWSTDAAGRDPLSILQSQRSALPTPSTIL